MEEKKEFKLFREKSLEAIESPESMNDYLQVTGAVLWSVFGRINTTVDVAVECSGEGRTCYVPYDNLESVMSAGHVTVDGNEYALQMDTDTKTMIISENTNPYIRVAGGLHIGDVAVQVPVDADLPNGIYTGTVTTESLQPIKLLIQ